MSIRQNGVLIKHRGGNAHKPAWGLKDGNHWFILSHEGAEDVFALSEEEFNEKWEAEDGP